MTIARWTAMSAFVVAAALGLAAVLSPSLRESVQARFRMVGREVLATADGDLFNNGSLAKVIKYRSEEGLFVEVLTIDKDGKSKVVDLLALPDKHDGLFNFHGHVTRLAIADIDEDGQVELLAPTFDNQLVPHLNVFRYNPASQRFEPYRKD